MHHRLTLFDKILARTVLPAIPYAVTPNTITFLRLVSVPFVIYFFWTEAYSIALPLFILSAFSDAIDGAIARTRDLVTNFGKLFDPLADKLLVASAAIVLIPRFIDWYIALIIIGIDLILISNAYLQKRYYGRIIQAENSGKIKMLLQVCGLIALLLFTVWGIPFLLVVAQYAFYGAIIFALLSLIVYRAV